MPTWTYSVASSPDASVTVRRYAPGARPDSEYAPLAELLTVMTAPVVRSVATMVAAACGAPDLSTVPSTPPVTRCAAAGGASATSAAAAAIATAARRLARRGTAPRARRGTTAGPGVGRSVSIGSSIAAGGTARGAAARVTDHELGLEQGGRRRGRGAAGGTVSADRRGELGDGAAAELEDRHAHRRQRRADVGGERDVVEAGERDGARHREPGGLERGEA